MNLFIELENIFLYILEFTCLSKQNDSFKFCKRMHVVLFIV